jgi:hypothetical protein
MGTTGDLDIGVLRLAAAVPAAEQDARACVRDTAAHTAQRHGSSSEILPSASALQLPSSGASGVAGAISESDPLRASCWLSTATESRKAQATTHVIRYPPGATRRTRTVGQFVGCWRLAFDGHTLRFGAAAFDARIAGREPHGAAHECTVHAYGGDSVRAPALIPATSAQSPGAVAVKVLSVQTVRSRLVPCVRP